jgi:mono/diheme cytochrome c family protein
VAVTGRVVCATIAFAAAAHVAAAENDFPPEQVRKGAAIYEQNCSPCHGNRMLDPDAAFNLRTFPPDQKPRFVNSVTKGLNAMPPWGDLLKPDDIDALWAYVRAGER